MCYNIMTKKENEEVLTFSRYCPIIDKIVTVEWGLREREIETYKLIEAQEAERKAATETN